MKPIRQIEKCFKSKTPINQICGDGKKRGRKPVQSFEMLKIKFWSRVDVGTSNQCWEWNPNGKVYSHGMVWFNGKPFKASRMAYFLTKGSPGNLLVCHKCDNPPCCNPKHLFLGTYRDNRMDCINKGRTGRAKKGVL